MFKLIAVGIVGVGVAVASGFMSPETKSELLSAAQKTMGFISRNTKVTEDYLACSQSQKKGEECNAQLVEGVLKQNNIKLEVKSNSGLIGK